MNNTNNTAGHNNIDRLRADIEAAGLDMAALTEAYRAFGHEDPYQAATLEYHDRKKRAAREANTASASVIKAAVVRESVSGVDHARSAQVKAEWLKRREALVAKRKEREAREAAGE